MKKSIFQVIGKKGINHFNIYDALHIPATEETAAIVKKCSKEKEAYTYYNEYYGAMWYDIPFAYDPHYGY